MTRMTPSEAIVPDTQDDPDGKWLALNTKFATIWPNITVKGKAPADADVMAKETGKLEKYFSEEPGKGS